MLVGWHIHYYTLRVPLVVLSFFLFVVIIPFLWNIFTAHQAVRERVLVAEKTGEWKKLENLQLEVGARPTFAPRNGRRDNVEGIMSTWGTSSPPILQIHSLHQVAMGTPSHVPLQRRAIIVAIFRGSGATPYGPHRLGLGTCLCVCGATLICIEFQNQFFCNWVGRT